MKRFAFCLFILVSAFRQLPFGIADGIELTDTSIGTVPGGAVDSTPDIQANSAPIDTTQAEKVSAESTKEHEMTSTPATTRKEASMEPAKSDEFAPSTADTDGKTVDNDGTTASAVKDEKKDESGESADVAFASIHSKGLTVADGNRWYYETFDRQGRSTFAVLYEDGTAIEKTEWAYKGKTRHPTKKQIFRADGSETFRYNEQGKELTIERYKGKTLTSKTENVYNSDGKLIEQTITAGKNTDKSVWVFAGDKAVSQTKYRNGKKTALIELGNIPHIIHLYVDDKEVYVGEEQ